jgi:hypothetical protein
MADQHPEIEIVKLRIRIPPVPQMEDWEDREPFTDDEDDEDDDESTSKPMLPEAMFDWFREHPKVEVKVDEEIGIFYFRGPAKDLRAMKKHALYESVEAFIYNNFKVWAIEMKKSDK